MEKKNYFYLNSGTLIQIGSILRIFNETGFGLFEIYDYNERDGFLSFEIKVNGFSYRELQEITDGLKMGTLQDLYDKQKLMVYNKH